MFFHLRSWRKAFGGCTNAHTLSYDDLMIMESHDCPLAGHLHITSPCRTGLNQSAVDEDVALRPLRTLLLAVQNAMKAAEFCDRRNSRLRFLANGQWLDPKILICSLSRHISDVATSIWMYLEYQFGVSPLLWIEIMYCWTSWAHGRAPQLPHNLHSWKTKSSMLRRPLH